MIKRYAQRIFHLLATTRLLRIPKTLVKKSVYYAITAKNGKFVFINKMVEIKGYYNPEILRALDLFSEIKKEITILLSEVEAIQIFRSVIQTSKIEGDIAEVGVFNGGSSKLICEAKGNKKLHLFDTFEGLPTLSDKDNPKQFSEKQFTASYEHVKDYLKKYDGVYFYKGLFPSTAGPVTNTKFSFVHLDVDLYETTLECLKFFYPRMNKGAILISHDYVIAKGVRNAFDEFFTDKPEPIIELEITGTQCLVVKT